MEILFILDLLCQNVDFEVRAGLNSVYDDPTKGWVADDVHSESASRTLAYACALCFLVVYHTVSFPHFLLDDDFAAYVLARELKKPSDVSEFLYERAMRAPFMLYNDLTGFMEARNKDGSWAGGTRGWTEGE